METISDDGLVMLKILKKADSYDRPKEGATVKIRYTAKLTDGTIFDERTEGNELEIVLDEGTPPFDSFTISLQNKWWMD